MWEKIVDYGRQLFTLTATVQRHDDSITELKTQLKGLRRDVNALAVVVQLDRQNAAKDREILLLRLENALLKQGRGELPPAPPTGGAS